MASFFAQIWWILENKFFKQTDKSILDFGFLISDWFDYKFFRHILNWLFNSKRADET